MFIDRPKQQRDHADANHRPLIYELDDAGVRLMRERGSDVTLPNRGGTFAHELLTCRILVSIELGVRADPATRLIAWPEILRSGKVPDATLRLPRPERVSAAFELSGQFHRTEIAADGLPFGIERTVDALRTYLFFPGIEADCGTEPIEPADAMRSSIVRKIVAYRAIVGTGAHRSHFGFPNFFVPIVTTSSSRMDSMMRLLDRITEGRGSKIFLFKVFPTATDKPPERGHMLSEPWARVGYPRFSLDR